MTEVYFTRPGYRDLEDLPGDLGRRVKRKLRQVREDPARYLKRLRGHDVHVLRVGDLRVILDWNRPESELYVHAIGHRSTVYDRDLR